MLTCLMLNDWNHFVFICMDSQGFFMILLDLLRFVTFFSNLIELMLICSNWLISRPFALFIACCTNWHLSRPCWTNFTKLIQFTRNHEWNSLKVCMYVCVFLKISPKSWYDWLYDVKPKVLNLFSSFLILL